MACLGSEGKFLLDCCGSVGVQCKIITYFVQTVFPGEVFNSVPGNEAYTFCRDGVGNFNDWASIPDNTERVRSFNGHLVQTLEQDSLIPFFSPIQDDNFVLVPGATGIAQVHDRATVAWNEALGLQSSIFMRCKRVFFYSTSPAWLSYYNANSKIPPCGKKLTNFFDRPKLLTFASGVDVDLLAQRTYLYGQGATCVENGDP